MKVKIYQKTGMFTTVCGVDVPVRSCLHEADSIPEAADWLAKYCGYDAQTVENGEFYFEEVD